MFVFIPVAQPVIGQEELDIVTKTLKSGWISSIGENITLFENKFAHYCGTKYGVATSNGTASLHLCLAAAEIGSEDEVIVPSMTFVATANAVIYTGAKPVFVDSETETWNIDPEKIKEKINRRTKAIIPVHLYGHPAQMTRILNLAKKYGLIVFEDAAEAHGAMYRGKRVGAFGKAGSFSFYGNKIITTGEGGMIVTNDQKFAERIRMLRDHGASRTKRYHHPRLGFNYRMTNIQAAIGLAQLGKIGKIIQAKRQVAMWYRDGLSNLLPRIILHPEADWAKNVFWMYSILIPSKGKITRDYLIYELKKVGIDSRPFFFPIHKHRRFTVTEKYPVSEYLSKTGINLPSSPNLTKEQVKYICDKISRIFEKN